MSGTKGLEFWRSFNNTRSDYPSDSSIPKLFEQQVDKTPEAVAIEWSDQSLTYLALNSHANMLAQRLVESGAVPGRPIGICVDRGPEMVVGLLAILKAGAAYLPLDPSFPVDRLKYYAADADITLLMTVHEHKGRLDDLECPLVIFNLESNQKSELEVSNPKPLGSPASLAYINYTSGSTGTPKGVAIPHRGVTRLVCNTNYLQINSEDRVAHGSTVSFDAATWEIWGPLLNGGTVVVLDKATLLSVDALSKFLSEKRISAQFLTAAVFNIVSQENPSAFSGLRTLLVGGEAMSPTSAHQVLDAEPPKELINIYGPTESTTFACYYKIESLPEEADSVPIGSPISNTSLYIVNEQLEPVEVGEPGELLIGGDGLALEYLNDPELTAEKFISNPFSDKPGERLYKTGDKVILTEDGTIDFIGRFDNQIKMRGYRIELGEIESSIRNLSGIQEVVALYNKQPPHSNTLIACYTCSTEEVVTPDSIKASLGKRLPDYMIPTVMMPLESIPLNSNGKIDRNILRSKINTFSQKEAVSEPSETDTERALEKIWCEVMDLTQVGRRQKFLDAGGHSLHATLILSRIRQHLEVEVSLNQFFKAETLEHLGDLVDSMSSEKTDSDSFRMAPVSREQDLPLSFSQERVWFVQCMNPDSLAYNFQAAFHFKGSLDKAILEKALSEVISRHEIFRTTFHNKGGTPVQVIHEPEPVIVPEVDLRNWPPDDREEEAQKRIVQESQRPFDMEKIPLIRWLLIQVEDNEFWLAHVEHHIIHDGWSFNVFINEFIDLYSAIATETRPNLPELPIQFADFAHWQHKWMEGPVKDEQLKYWMGQLNDRIQVLDLPTDKPRPPVQSFQGKAAVFELPIDLCRALKELSKQEGKTLFVTMLTAFVILLHRYTGQRFISVGTGVANRRWTETENMLGMLINNLVLLSEVQPELSFKELMDHVETVCMEAYNHQDLPFDHLVQSLHLQRDSSRNPLFQVMFAFHDSPMPNKQIPDVESRVHMGISNGSAKFDMNIIVIPHRSLKIESERDIESDGMRISWEYATDLFEAETIDRMVSEYQGILQAMVKNSTDLVSSAMSGGYVTSASDAIAEKARIVADQIDEPLAEKITESIQRDLSALTPTESQVISIFKSVLEVDNVSPGDDFFELGGHSLMAMKVISRILDEMGVSLTIIELFDAPNANAIARLIEARLNEE